jgi:inorganic pyrophosphatase
MNAPVELINLPAQDADTGLVNVIIDTPKGCRNKYKYDAELGLFRLRKVLPLEASFPYDFGFIPSTRGEDGDPVDVLVLMDEPTFCGCLVSVRLIGVIEAEQTEKDNTFRNDRLIGVVETSVNPAEWTSLPELSKSRLDEIEHFFVSYNDAEGRQFKPLRRAGPRAAEKLVAESMRQFEETGDSTDR